MKFGFDCFHKDKKTNARAGIIHTPHGDIETPVFVPVGTQASVKSLTPDELKELQVELFFVNTYHMYLRPGIDVVAKAGGLHRFMAWDGPIMTDSGGFQVFSLGRKRYATKSDTGEGESELVRISDDGVTFRSHWDGSEHEFTPEKSMEYQWQLGSDIHIAFDDCTAYGVTHKQAEKSLERTHRWAERSLDEHQRLASLSSRGNPPVGGDRSDLYKDCFVPQSGTRNDRKKTYQALYGSIQGSIYKDLREKSAKFITSLPFDGYAIGGVAVGESKEEMKNVLDWVCPYLPEEKLRHLLGVGEIDDIFTLVEHGIDTFDCVQPTRLARMGRVYCHRDPERSRGRSDLYNRDCFVLPQSGIPRNDKQYEIDILKKAYEEDMRPIEKGCGCYTCRHFTRAYLHHLFKVRELLGYRLATIHNISFINRLMSEIRLAIQEGSLVALKESLCLPETKKDTICGCF